MFTATPYSRFERLPCTAFFQGILWRWEACLVLPSGRVLPRCQPENLHHPVASGIQVKY